MAVGLTIGKLAAAACVPITTVRYYERRGLLRPATRLGSGSYRVYGKRELARLLFVRAAQRAGFSLRDIAALLSFRDGLTSPCKEVQTLIEERLRSVRERLEELKKIEHVLCSSLAACRRFERTGRCKVIDTLSTRKAGAGSSYPRPVLGASGARGTRGHKVEGASGSTKAPRTSG